MSFNFSDSRAVTADQVLSDYHHAMLLDQVSLQQLTDALLNPLSPQLHALFGQDHEQGYQRVWDSDTLDLVHDAMANDPATFLSEALERGCIAVSLKERMSKGGIIDPRLSAIRLCCDYIVATCKPGDDILDLSVLERLLRARVLATQSSGARSLFQSLSRNWRRQAAILSPVEAASRSERVYLAAIDRLEAAEVATRALAPGASFAYADYALLRDLRAASRSTQESPALQRLARERDERKRRQAALLSPLLPELQAFLAAALNDVNFTREPLEHSAYRSLLALRRDRLGMVFHDFLRLCPDYPSLRQLGPFASYEVGKVAARTTNLVAALHEVRIDLATRRIELDDDHMARVLAWAPLASTKLLASVGWTLAQGSATLTRAALTASIPKAVREFGAGRWASSVASLLAKHPQEQQPAERSEEPTSRPVRPPLSPRHTERYRKLVGGDTHFPGHFLDGSRSSAEKFYLALYAIPEVLDPLWIILHETAYTLDAQAAPGAAWLKLSRGLVERYGADLYLELLRRVLDLLDPQPRTSFLGLNTARALIYLAVDRPADQIAPILVDFALRRCFVSAPRHGIKGERLGNACLWTLIHLPDGGGIPYLARLLARVKYPKVRKRIDAALNEAARAAGISRGSLDELSIATHDLDASSARIIPVGSGFATLRATIDGAALEWRSADGKALKNANAAMKADKDAMAKVKAEAKDLDADLAAQAIRLQRLYLAGCSWPFDQWRERYLDHPLIQPFARSIIWWAQREGERTSFLPTKDGPQDANGQPVPLGGAMIGLWHPVEDEEEMVQAWRNRIETLDLRQPFAQAWREIYRLTDAERTTGTYSNRWAGHILKQHQAMMLARINGWTVTHRMWVDSANDAPWHLQLPAHGLVVDYWIEGPRGDDAPETLDSLAYVHVSSDRMAFYRVPDGMIDSAYGGPRDTPVDLADVPAVVFSEVMRHGDLLTGVASIAADPLWNDCGGEARHPNQWRRDAAEYWERAGWSELTAAGENRKALLDRIIPRLSIADRCSWETNALIVQGKRHSYRIHLGSGAIRIVESSRHLCIVPKTQNAPDVRLPFVGDHVLSIILSKAILLAADDMITDPVILAQL